MNVIYSELIHAKTRDQEFGFIVRPEDLTESDLEAAKKYVTSSTKRFEGHKMRRVVFRCGNNIINGVSVMIAELYRLCGRPATQYAKVNSTRDNYAFIGLSVPLDQNVSAFSIPYEVYLDIYEKWIAQLWESTSQVGCTATYMQHELPAAVSFCDLPDTGRNVIPSVISTSYCDTETIAASVTREQLAGNDISFCSDMPDAAVVAECGFDIITSDAAENVRQNLERRLAEASAPLQDKHFAHETYHGFDEIIREQETAEALHKKRTKFIAGAVLFGLGTAAAVISKFLTKQDE